MKVLKNFSAKFKLGETTAIVGPSGSGKSTIVQLIERFYEPSAGEIFIDGVPLKSINLRCLRKQIGYVQQEPVLFNTTIRKNILLGNAKATDLEIENALRKTNAYGFVSAMQNGVEEFAGSGGNALSGG